MFTEVVMIAQTIRLLLAAVTLAALPVGLTIATAPDDGGLKTGDASAIPTDPTENWLEDAEALMADRRFAEAGALLSAGVDRMPDGWRPISKDGERVVLAAWDLGEFLRFSDDSDPLSGPSVVWVTPSYSKAHYLLAVIGAETGDVQGAFHHVVRAIELQPYHPLVIHEAAIILRRIGGVAEALAILEKGSSVPAWLMTPERQALLERSRGVTLVELGRLDEAEEALRAALELEPDSAVAREELEYIARLRARGEAAREPITLTPLTVEGEKR